MSASSRYYDLKKATPETYTSQSHECEPLNHTFTRHCCICLCKALLHHHNKSATLAQLKLKVSKV